MKRSRFLFRINSEVPNLKESGITEDDLTALLNEGVDKTNIETGVYQTVTTFASVAEQQIYQLSVVAPTFLGPVKKRLRFLDSNGDWQWVYPKTLEWIEKNYRDYLNADSSPLPQWYWIEGDDLGIHPKADASTSNAIRLPHLKKATGMSGNDTYPWTGTSVELTALLPLDDAIIAYVKWKLSPSIGAVTDLDLREAEFLKQCRLGAKKIKRRPDITSEQGYRLRI